MFSSSLSISEFFSKVEGHSVQEIIQMTNQEATDVERMYYKACRNEAECGKIVLYARYLKDFILYLRYGIKTQKIRDLDLAAFQKARPDH